jgi:hypothetical protein
MRWSLRLMILLITLFGLFSCMAAPAPVMADYGLAYPFRTGAILRYPDFTLTYVGERRVSSDLFPNGFLYHDFSVVTTSDTSTISWSAGTGDIGPTPFTVGSERYFLELERSDTLGALPDNSLVVRRSAP